MQPRWRVRLVGVAEEAAREARERCARQAPAPDVQVQAAPVVAADPPVRMLVPALPVAAPVVGDGRTAEGRVRLSWRRILDADASRYTGPRTLCGAPDQRTKAGREWGAQQTLLAQLESGVAPAREYAGPRKKDGTPDYRTRAGRAWRAREQLRARLSAQQYTGRTKTDGSPDYRTTEGRDWSARCQLLQALAAPGAVQVCHVAQRPAAAAPYAGPRKKDGTPDYRTKAGRAWRAREQQLMQALPAPA